MATVLTLHKTKHPNKDFQRRYEELFGMEAQKQDLLASLELILNPDHVLRWQQRHHKNGFSFFRAALRHSPLIILSGDVGCGKTELASTIGSPLAKVLGGETVVTFETPSNIRGTGLVGEVSARITAAFADAKLQLSKHEFGLLVIDEADDLATTRSQDQAHHEDRAGVNALIKEIDSLERDQCRMAVLLITNRPEALDPAVMRRAATHLRFERPEEIVLRDIFMMAAEDIPLTDPEIQQLVEHCLTKQPLFTYSDIFRKVVRTAFLDAIAKDTALSFGHLLHAIQYTTPSPTFHTSSWKNQKDS